MVVGAALGGGGGVAGEQGLVLAQTGAGRAGVFTLFGATIVSDLWGTARYAALNGVFGTPLAVTGAVGPLVGAAIAGGVGGYPACFVVLALMTAMGAVVLVIAVPRQKTFAPILNS